MTREYRTIVEHWDRSPEAMFFLDDDHLIVAAQDEGRLKLFRISISGNATHELTKTGSFTSWSIWGQKVLGLYDSMTQPAEIYSVDTETGNMDRLSNFNDMSRFQLSEPEEIWFTAADGSQAHGWVLKPFDFDPSKTYPLAYLIHGGPEGAWNDDWSYRWNPQMWASAHYFSIFC